MRRTDVIYYGGYLTLFILFGIWMLVWALNMAGIGQAFLLWLLSAGIILMVVGVINASGPTASNLQLAGGMGLSAFMLILLALSGDIIGGAVGASVGIILIGIIGLVLLFRRIKLEE